MEGYEKKTRVWEVAYAKTGEPVQVGQVQAIDFEEALKQARHFQPVAFKIAHMYCIGTVARMEQPSVPQEGNPEHRPSVLETIEREREAKDELHYNHGLGTGAIHHRIPQSKVGQYISCQYCHKPAGDRQTKDEGICYDCKREIIAAGHEREAEYARKLERERLATGHA